MVVLVAALAGSLQGIAAPDCVMADSAVLGDLSSQPLSNTRRRRTVVESTSNCGAFDLLPLQTFETFPQSAVAIPLEGERCCPISVQDFLEDTAQNSIVL